MATVIGTFIVALIVLHLITMRIADFVVDCKIGPLDRTLGFIFGVARGVAHCRRRGDLRQLAAAATQPAGLGAGVQVAADADPSVGDGTDRHAAADDLEKQVTDILQRAKAGGDEDRRRRRPTTAPIRRTTGPAAA